MRDDFQQEDDSPDSCLVSRLSQYASIGDAEKRFVSRIERDERAVRSGETIISCGAPLDEVFVLAKGWAVILSQPRREESQIIRVHLPGELIGWAEIGSGKAHHTVKMLTDGVICPFPRSGLAELYNELPRLAALFTSIASLDHIALRDHLTMLGLAPARERMAHFLSDLLFRLRVPGPNDLTSFDLPMRQTDLAAALGITPVYVSKLLRDMNDDGLIATDRPRITIPDPDRLARLGRYRQSPRKIDLSWMEALLHPEEAG